MNRGTLRYVLVGSALLLAQWVVAAEMASIARDDSTMRSGPGTGHSILWKLDAGFPVEVLGSKGEWRRLKDFEGSTGWVHQKAIQTTPFVIVKANRGSEQQINVRKEPNTASDVVATARYGVVFRVLARKESWVKVEHDRGVSGWVDGRLLWGL